MTTSVLKVDGMSCEHCVKAIKKALGEITGVNNVSVDLQRKIVAVEHDHVKAKLSLIKSVIEDQGYEVVE